MKQSHKRGLGFLLMVAILAILVTSAYAAVNRTWKPRTGPGCPTATNDICIEGYSVYVTFVKGEYTPENSFPYPFPIAEAIYPATSATIYVHNNDVPRLYSAVKAHASCRNEITGVYEVCESGYFDEIKLSADDSPPPDSSGGNGGSGGSCFISTLKEEPCH